MLGHSCIFPYLFETRPPVSSEKMTRYVAVPRPFALFLPDGIDGWSNGEDVTQVEVTLMGRACHYVAYIVRAFEFAGERGLGARKIPFRLQEATESGGDEETNATPFYVPGGECCPPQPDQPRPPACPEAAQITLLSPTRLKRDGDLVTPETFEVRVLLSNLVRRVSMLMYFHSENQLEADFATLRAIAARITTLHTQLRWHDWTRRSSRQGTTMQMGGLLGTIEIDLRGAELLWPYLWLGQWTQAGKGTTMGLGRYRIAASAGDALAATGIRS